MICPDCLCEPFETHPGEWECLCGQEQEEAKPYINHCWNCYHDIDSRVCKPSPYVGMGYICNHCGKDLSEWKMKFGGPAGGFPNRISLEPVPVGD
jgi:hypothetical protein